MTGNIDGLEDPRLAQLAQIEAEVKPYEEEEKKLWEEYISDVDEELDSDELFKEYQLRVSSDIIIQKDVDALNVLDRLLQLRHKKDRLRYVSRTSPEPNQDEHFWAVIVGINNYDDEGTANLCGCVSDAFLVYDYLTVDLGVPQSHISLLLSPALSDSDIPFKYGIHKILDALYDLHAKNDIQTDDNIVLFFAGHAASYKLAEPNIEAICPMDRSTSRLESDGDIVLDISDREINVILGDMAKKTSNITLILDCFDYQSWKGGRDMAGTVLPPIDIRSCFIIDILLRRQLQPHFLPGTQTRGFSDGDEDSQGALSVRYQNYWYNWPQLVKQLPPDQRKQTAIVALESELNDIESEIREKTRTEKELWKGYCGLDGAEQSDSDDVDSDALLKECQHRVNAGDVHAQDHLTCLGRLHELNKTKHALLLTLSSCFDRDGLGVYSGRDSPNEFKGSNGRRFHAVIVGINRYNDPGTTPLQGCVNDALLFHDYLIHDLCVPANQITLLLSPTGDERIPFSYATPTRENILNAICDLHDNPNIKPDDSIIIFYAGHGQSYPAAETSYTPLNTGSIEAISPADRNTSKSNADGTKGIVVDISDRELNVILGEIAKNKCPNITLVLDCCFSGGGTRDCSPASNSFQLTDKELSTPRNCPPIPFALPLMFKAADASGRLSPDRPRTADPNFRANMKSHVLVASAKDYEEALEYTDRKTRVSQGYFTSRFISALRSSPSTATYRDVIRSPDLVMPFQTAIVAGRKTATLWFT